MRARGRDISALTVYRGVALATFLFVGTRAISQPSPEAGRVHLEAEIDRTDIRRDERLRFTVRVSWKGGQDEYEFQWPSQPECDGLTVAGASSSNEVRFEEGNRITIRRFSYVLEPTASGPGRIGAVSLLYTVASTGENHTLRTKALSVTIRDVPSGATGLSPVPLIVSLATMCIGGILLWRWRRRRKVRQEAPAQPSTPEESARGELGQLRTLTSSGAYREYYDGIASLLRRYIRRTWDIECSRLGTADIVLLMRDRAEVPEDTAERFRKVLSECDLVKFAGHAPTSEAVKHMATKVEELLSTSKSV